MSTDPRGAARYGSVAMALHWLIGLVLIAQTGFGFLLDDLAPRGTPARTDIINLHKSTGVVLGLAIALRLAWRLWHSPPDWPGGVAHWQRRAATIGHRLLYACMLVMPLSGYLGSNFSRHGIRFFGHAWPAWGPALPSVYAFFNTLHVVTGWLFALLVAGHVAAALKHAWFDRDDVFARMLPARFAGKPP